MILIGFGGFLIFDELSSLKCKNGIVEHNYLQNFIENAKMINTEMETKHSSQRVLLVLAHMTCFTLYKRGVN